MSMLRSMVDTITATFFAVCVTFFLLKALEKAETKVRQPQMPDEITAWCSPSGVEYLRTMTSLTPHLTEEGQPVPCGPNLDLGSRRKKTPEIAQRS